MLPHARGAWRRPKAAPVCAYAARVLAARACAAPLRVPLAAARHCSGRVVVAFAREDARRRRLCVAVAAAWRKGGQARMQPAMAHRLGVRWGYQAGMVGVSAALRREKLVVAPADGTGASRARFEEGPALHRGGSAAAPRPCTRRQERWERRAPSKHATPPACVLEELTAGLSGPPSARPSRDGRVPQPARTNCLFTFLILMYL